YVRAIEVCLDRLCVQLRARFELVYQTGFAAGCRERRDEILVRTRVVDDRAGLDDARPAYQSGHAERTFPVGRLLALERRRAAIGPGEDLGAVVGRVDYDGV